MALWFISYIHNRRKCARSVRGYWKCSCNFYPTLFYASPHFHPQTSLGTLDYSTLRKPSEYLMNPEVLQLYLGSFLFIECSWLIISGLDHNHTNISYKEAHALVFFPPIFLLRNGNMNNSKEWIFKKQKQRQVLSMYPKNPFDKFLYKNSQKPESPHR